MPTGRKRVPPDFSKKWTPSNSFGNRLHLFRFSAGLTAKQIGDVVGVDAKTIFDWEQGHAGRDLDKVVAKISKEWKIDPIWLMWGNDDDMFS